MPQSAGLADYHVSRALPADKHSAVTDGPRANAQPPWPVIGTNTGAVHFQKPEFCWFLCLGLFLNSRFIFCLSYTLTGLWFWNS